MIKTQLDKFDIGDFHSFLFLENFVTIFTFPTALCKKKKKGKNKDTNTLFHFTISRL